MNILHTSCAEQVSLPKMHRAVVKIKHGLNDICCGIVIKCHLFYTNLYQSLLFCVEILVCLRHLEVGTQGLTDALVLPHLQLTWLLITLATARQIIPLLWKANKKPSVSAWLSKLIL